MCIRDSGLRDAKHGRWDKALGNFTKMESSQVNEILKPLLLGWSYLGKKDLPKARQNLLSLKKKRGFELLSLLHTALALRGHVITGVPPLALSRVSAASAP